MLRRSTAFEARSDRIEGVSAPIELRINRRAKRLIVRVDVTRRVVVITAPSKRAAPDALRFAQSRAGWIAEQLALASPGLIFVDGASFPFRGAPHVIRAAPTQRAHVERVETPEPAFVVGGDPQFLNRRLTDWLKSEARRVLSARADDYAARIGAVRGRIAVRDPHTRWGSCSQNGGLMFSWRLILAPPDILDYVVAHECAHLRHLDHSAEFWSLVDRLGVSRDSAHRWFRTHGRSLHHWGG